MKIIHNALSGYKSDVIELYRVTFPSSLTDLTVLDTYINQFLNEESACLAIDNDLLIGALLYSPLLHDKDLPSLITKNFNAEKSVYIAEMMVRKSYHGKGIGTDLLESFFNSIDINKYTDAFIRVWDQNQVAIGLYKKMGFIPYTQIDQVKKTADGSGTFTMKKIYLHIKL